MSVSKVFNPYVGRLRAHPNRNINSPFLLGVNRVASKTITLLSSSALIISHPTNTNVTAFTIYHIDGSGNYVNRENVDWQFDFSSQSTKATVISFKSEIQSASISTTNFVLGGTINSAVLSTSLPDFISWIKPSKLVTSSILSLTTEDVCKANACRSQLALGIPVNVGIEFCECYPEEPLVDGQATIPTLSTQTPGYTLSGNLGVSAIDATDSAIVHVDGTFTSAISLTEDVTISNSTPIVPTVIGDGCTFDLNVFTGNMVFPVDTTVHFTVAITMYVLSLTGNVLLSKNRVLTVAGTSGTLLTTTRLNTVTQFALNPEEVGGVQDVFVWFGIGTTATSTVVAAPLPLSFVITSVQPARKRFGFGPGTVVSYVSGASVGMAMQINASQMCLHEPKPGVLQGYEATPVAYSQPLYKAIKTLQSQPDVFELRNLFPMKDEKEISMDFLFWVEILSMSNRLRNDDSPEVMSDLESIISKYPKQFSGELPTEMPEAKASFKSFLRRASKWLNRNVAKPLLTPVGQAVHQAAKNFGSIGANVITNASTNLINNALQPRADTSSFYQIGPKIPEFNFNRKMSLSSTRINEINEFLFQDLFPEVAYLDEDDFKRVCSTRQYANAGREIQQASNQYYRDHPNTDYATIETSLPTIDVDVYDITEFPVVLEGDSEISQAFGKLEGAQLHCIVSKSLVPDHCLVSQSPKNLVYNCSDETVPISKEPIVLMKMIKKQGRTVTLAAPGRFLEGHSFLLARDMWDRGFRGHGIAYSGAVVDGSILPIPADTMGAKKACCARNEVVLVGNSPLADVRVSNFGDLYRTLLIFCNSNPNFKPVASFRSYSCTYEPIGKGKLTNPNTGKVVNYKEYYASLKDDIKYLLSLTSEAENTPLKRFLELSSDLHIPFEDDTKLVALKTSDILSVVERGASEDYLSAFAQTVTLDGLSVSAVEISFANNVYLITLGVSDYLITFKCKSTVSEASVLSSVKCYLKRPCASMKSFATIDNGLKTKPIPGKRRKEKLPQPQSRILPVTQTEDLLKTIKDLLKSEVKNQIQPTVSNNRQVTAAKKQGKEVPPPRFNTTKYISDIVQANVTDKSKKDLAQLKKKLVISYELEEPSKIPMKVLKMMNNMTYKGVVVPLLSRVSEDYPKGIYSGLPNNFLKFCVFNHFKELEPNQVTEALILSPDLLKRIFNAYKVLALDQSIKNFGNYYSEMMQVTDILTDKIASLESLKGKRSNLTVPIANPSIEEIMKASQQRQPEETEQTDEDLSLIPIANKNAHTIPAKDNG